MDSFSFVTFTLLLLAFNLLIFLLLLCGARCMQGTSMLGILSWVIALAPLIVLVFFSFRLSAGII